MNLRDFFESERKRVHIPGPFFTGRVMARLRIGRRSENGIWEMIPNSVRPVLALALMVIICSVVVELFVPPIPQRGMIEASLESEQSPGEGLLYGEDEVPAGQELLEQLIVLEEVK